MTYIQYLANTIQPETPKLVMPELSQLEQTHFTNALFVPIVFGIGKSLANKGLLYEYAPNKYKLTNYGYNVLDAMGFIEKYAKLQGK